MTDKKYKRPGLYAIGGILVVIGAGSTTISPFLLYLYFLPLWIFLLGLIFIWISDRKIGVKLAWTITPFIVFFLFQFLWIQYNKVPPETFLIPSKYRGTVRVHFNEPCGKAIEEANGRRIYRVPNTGILISQFRDKQGFIDQQYYFVDSLGKRTVLPQLDVRDYNEEWTTVKNPHEPSRDILGIFHAGQVSSDGTYEFYVSTYRHLSDTFNFRYDRRFDSIDQKAIELCRQCKQ